MTINIGFIGLSSTGWASTALAPSIFSLKDKYKVVALSTSNESSALASAKKYGDQEGYSIKPYHGDATGTAISADPDVDLVAISVRVDRHKLVLMPALEAGKDVFVEWPAGVGLDETKAFAELAKRNHIKSFVGLQGRHSPAVRKLKQLVDEGTLGRILSTNLITMAAKELLFIGPWINEGNLHTIDGSIGASLLEIGVGHLLDAFTFALGPIASVSATLATQYPTSEVMTTDYKPTGKTIPSTVPDQIAFTTTLVSGAVSTFHWRGGVPISTSPRPAFTWIIDGEKGSVTISGDGPAAFLINSNEPKIFFNGKEVKTEDDGLGNVGRAWAAFANPEGGDYATLYDALQVKKVLDGIMKSGKEGRRIDIN